MNECLNNRCPVCSSAGIEFFFRLDDVPIFCNVLYRTPEEAERAARGTITLGLCLQCTHIFNGTFESDRVTYTPAYENSLHYSPHFRRFAERLAAELVERYEVRNTTVVDIGCGRGDFLKLMVELGNNTGIGFDASYDPDTSLPDERITIVREFFSAASPHPPGDLYTCRHVLEHLPHPTHLLREVHAAMQRTPRAILYVEVPNALWMLERGGIWDVIYEHCSYFTHASLQRLLEQCGFQVLRLEESFNGQYIAAECTLKNAARHAQSKHHPDPARCTALAHSFSDKHLRKVKEWTMKLEALREEGKRIVVWGTGSKGVTFVNMVNGTHSVGHVVDVNPRKHGMYTPGTAHRVIAPEQLRASKPDVVIVMNPVYADEIRSALDGLGLTPQIFFA